MGNTKHSQNASLEEMANAEQEKPVWQKIDDRLTLMETLVDSRALSNVPEETLKYLQDCIKLNVPIPIK